MRVLVAEDDRPMSMLFCGMLRAAGHQPIPAFDGASAMMAAMRSPAPDLIVLDLGMPAGTGQTTLAKLQASTKTATIPVIVVTASKDAATRAEVKALGATSFLEKPINADTFLAAVEAYGPQK